MEQNFEECLPTAQLIRYIQPLVKAEVLAMTMVASGTTRVSSLIVQIKADSEATPQFRIDIPLAVPDQVTRLRKRWPMATNPVTDEKENSLGWLMD
jgi:hypothetical protein